MKFTETELPGAYVIDPVRRGDERGFFARIFCTEEFEARGLDSSLIQSSISYNYRAGTLRGMHYQVEPHLEAKLVRCTMGAIYDVIIDLRPESPTFSRHIGLELTAENRRMLYVPEGFAHGFQTLVDGAEVSYHMNRAYVADSAAGVRADDTAFGIAWPLPISEINDRDRHAPDFDPAAFSLAAKP